MNKYGFVRIAACSPEVVVGNPKKNVDNILGILGREDIISSDIIVFPELCITGYTCRDLFGQQRLIESAAREIMRLTLSHSTSKQLILVGAPVAVNNSLFNCAIAIGRGRVLGIVPKQNIPTYKEFEESRWFRGACGDEPKEITFRGVSSVPFGTDLLFCNGIKIGVEICEDLWMPIPPSSYQALAGASILLNLSASNETVAKNEYRNQLVANQSGRCVAAYAYASAGPSESTTDLVFGGHCLIAENGSVLASSERVGQPINPVAIGEKYIVQDVDTAKLLGERRQLSSFGEASKNVKSYREIAMEFQQPSTSNDLKRTVGGNPFIPKDEKTLHNRCAEIFGIQCCGLYKRLSSIGWPDVYIGVSGGLDSTLALLVAVKTFLAAKQPLTKIHGITMPGYGTTTGTNKNAINLMMHLGIKQETIDIRAATLQMFKDIKHDPFKIGMFHPSVKTELYNVEAFVNTLKHLEDCVRIKGDLTFENVQARMRTMVLMSKGFVLGTGDLSELALGWCTYNGDHMSMYNVNASIPKTLVKFLVHWVAEVECSYEKQDQGTSLDILAAGPNGADKQFNGLFNCLMDIYKTTISPELLPANSKGEIAQSTEDIIGPYELHDFFLFNFVRNGFSPEKILWLSDFAKFEKEYSREFREKTLKTFIQRFFNNQFKRSCVPDGPKVGSVSLSPRGDWRMPSDADASIWLEK